MRQLLQELGFAQDKPTELKNDNSEALIMAKSKFCKSNSRHVKLHFHYIREQVTNGEVTLLYCPTSAMIADILTKALHAPQFIRIWDILMNTL